MNRQKVIQPILAALMLCLFAFSITPRKTLHNLFGCHPETAKETNCHRESLATETFHCSCDQPEMQAPFLDQTVLTGIVAPLSFQNLPLIPCCAPLCESTTILTKLRGPPTTVQDLFLKSA